MRIEPFHRARAIFERKYFKEVLKHSSSYRDGARRAKLSTTTFWRYCKRYGLRYSLTHTTKVRG